MSKKIILPSDKIYNPTIAEKAVTFINLLKHTKGEWHGKPFELIGWQDKIIRDLFGTVKQNGYRQYNTAYIEIPKKQGKQLALDTIIPTPGGFTTMGELKVGDKVIDENGRPCNVVAMSEIDNTEQAYKLTFRNGEEITAGARHLWEIEFTRQKYKKDIVSTQDLYNISAKDSGEDNRALFRIPIAKPFSLPKNELSFDPYTFGFWLGNGNATKPELTINRDDVESVIKEIPYKVHNRYVQEGNSDIVKYCELKSILVGGYKEKRISKEYLRASCDDRLSLLQGLMDSDGSISVSRGQGIYCTILENLAKDVSELLWTLGIKNTINKSKSTRFIRWTGEYCYNVKFTCFDDIKHSILERKLKNRIPRNSATRTHFHYIKSIEKVPRVPMRCIQVDSRSHMYLVTKSMIPTHNSELAAAVALYLLAGDGEWGAEVYGCAADRQQASIVFDVACQMVEQCPALKRRIKPILSQKRLVYTPLNSFYQVLSSESYCMDYKTLLQKADGSMVEARDVKAGDTVLGWGEGKPEYGRVNSVEFQKPCESLRIRTVRGRDITVSGNHRFLVMERGRRAQDLTHKYNWVKASELAEGDRIRVKLGQSDCKTDSNQDINNAWALGAWAGDGDCGHFRFISADDEIVVKLKDYLNSIGSDLYSIYSTKQKQGANNVNYPYEHIIKGIGKRRKCSGREWIKDNFGKKSNAFTKRIPKSIFLGGEQVLAAFLAGYLDTDGCVPTDCNIVTFSSASLKLLKDCQELFSRLGINASVNEDTKGHVHMLSVSGREQLEALYEKIAPHLALSRKRKILKSKLNRHGFKYSAHESDRIAKIMKIGKHLTVSLEIEGIHTHITNGLVSHNSKHGLNVHGVVFDELHAQPNRDLFDVMTHGSGDARKQPLFFLITTAGTDRNSICYEVHQKAEDIIKGRKHDKSFYPVIYGIDEKDDWSLEKNWYKANPSLDITVDIEKLRTAFESAKENPAEENLFRQLRLNQWVKQSVRWMPMDKWDKCAFEVDLEMLKGRECYGGLDLSSSTDITAFVLVFPPVRSSTSSSLTVPYGHIAPPLQGSPRHTALATDSPQDCTALRVAPLTEDEKYIVLPYFWVPEETLELRVRRDHVPYDIWKANGSIMTTEGNVVHYGFIEKFIEDLGKIYNIKEIAFDRWGAVQMTQNLEGLGFTVVPFGQGFKDMSPPTKELMKLVLEQKLSHGGNLPLRWMMDNVFVRTDPAANIKMDKEKSTERIDGAVATVMALDRAIRNLGTEESVYNRRGIIII